MDEQSITITQEQLRRALQIWEQSYRDGKTMSHADADQLDVDEVATRSAAYLWAQLSQQAPE
jgi:hypothetical protein